MAKGDHARVEKQIQREGDFTRGQLTDLQSNLADQSNMYQGLFKPVVGQQLSDYSGLMGNYNNFINSYLHILVYKIFKGSRYIFSHFPIPFLFFFSNLLELSKCWIKSRP